MSELFRDVVTALVLASVGYAFTNLDNLLIMIALLDGGRRARAVIPGYLLASLAVLVAALAFTAIAFVLPPQLLGWLGLVPVLVGARMLLRPQAATDTSADTSLTAGSVGMLLLGNSSDTLVAFGPLFAESELRVVWALAAGYAASVVVFLLLASRLSKRLAGEPSFAKSVEKLVPYLMIGIGIYILLNTGTDRV